MAQVAAGHPHFPDASGGSNVFDRQVEPIPVPEKITMKTMTKYSIAICAMLCGGTVLAQDHALTYSKITRPVDTAVTIAGDTYTIARLPVVDLETEARYVLTLAAPNEGGVFLSTFAIASHKPADFASNMLIDGFPAQVQVFDSVSYSLNSDFFEGGNVFTVIGTASVVVAIDLGESVVTLSHSISTKTGAGDPLLTDVNIGATANAVPFATWGRYDDDFQLSAVNAADKWIDYIRVVAQ